MGKKYFLIPRTNKIKLTFNYIYLFIKNIVNYYLINIIMFWVV